MISDLISDLSNYPFLVDLERFLEKEGFPKSIDDLLASAYAEAGYRRVIEDLDPSASSEKTPPNDYKEKILGFYIALALVSMTGDRRIFRAFAEAEARRIFRVLLNKDPREILGVMKMLGYRVEETSEKELCSVVDIEKSTFTPRFRCYAYKIPLADYLRIAAQIAIDDEYKPVNRPVSKGYVYIENREVLARLCSVISRTRIETMLRPIPAIDAAKKYLEGILDLARRRFGEPRIERDSRGGQQAREKYSWIEKVISKGLPDGRKRFILYVLTPYLATILKLEEEEAMKIVKEFIDNSCRNHGKCEKIYDSWIRSCLRGAKQKGIKPARLENLDEELRRAIESTI